MICFLALCLLMLIISFVSSLNTIIVLGDRFGTLDESFIPTFNFMSKFPVTAVLFLFIYLFSTIFNEIKIKKEA